MLDANGVHIPDRWDEVVGGEAATTLDHIDALRLVADALRSESYGDWAPALERAADHLDDLAGQVLTLEADVARLNLLAESALANLNAVSQWTNWAQSLQPDGGHLLTPRGLLQAYPGLLLSIHPQPRKETPPRE